VKRYRNIKLYQSIRNSQAWIAYTNEEGYVVFPARVGGWSARRPVSGLDPFDLREVPITHAFNTGLPGAGVVKLPVESLSVGQGS
jgi:hypothetical protein